MRMPAGKIRRIFGAIEALAIIAWMVVLRQSSSYDMGYLLFGVPGIYLAVKHGPLPAGLNRREKTAVFLLAAVFSLAVVMAEYRLMTGPAVLFAMYLAGWATLAHVLAAFYRSASQIPPVQERRSASGARRVFLAVFAGFSGVNLIHLFASAYPGNMTVDSYNQLEQILTGAYSNHHPYWHTRLMGVFIKLGTNLFGSINAGVAAANVVQIMLMGFCFAFAVMTAYQAGVKKKAIVILGCWYALIPYNIMYSCTMWKDVLFGGAVLLLIAVLYRIFCNLGDRRINYALLCLSMLGTSLLRNNGWLALLASMAIWVVLFGKKRMKTALVMLLMLAAAWAMKGPVLDRLNVAPSNFRESLSIPIQQIARVVKDQGEITPKQRELIADVIDIERIPELYHGHISDPVKFAVDGDHVQAHKGEYLKLWLEIGMQNPVVYLHAWIDQTRGYWHNGYNYKVWFSGVQENDFGVFAAQAGQWMHAAFNRYCDILTDSQVLAPLRSIGLHAWLLLALLTLNLLRREKEKVFLGIPVLMLLGTLLAATPVYCEFRYAYALFTVLPMYLLISLERKACKE